MKNHGLTPMVSSPFSSIASQYLSGSCRKNFIHGLTAVVFSFEVIKGIRFVNVDGFACCSSGPARRKWNNKHHLVDPKTGKPPARGLHTGEIDDDRRCVFHGAVRNEI